MNPWITFFMLMYFTINLGIWAVNLAANQQQDTYKNEYFVDKEFLKESIKLLLFGVIVIFLPEKER